MTDLKESLQIQEGLQHASSLRRNRSEERAREQGRVSRSDSKLDRSWHVHLLSPKSSQILNWHHTFGPKEFADHESHLRAERFSQIFPPEPFPRTQTTWETLTRPALHGHGTIRHLHLRHGSNPCEPSEPSAEGWWHRCGGTGGEGGENQVMFLLMMH